MEGEELGGKRERDRDGEAKDEYPSYGSLSKCSQKQRARNTMQASQVGGKNLFICTITYCLPGCMFS